jgi:hypothetical protein
VAGPGAAGLGWHAPETQQSVVGQSALLRHPPVPTEVAPPLPEITVAPPVPLPARAPPVPVARPPVPPLPMAIAELSVAGRVSATPASRPIESRLPASDSIVTHRPYVVQYCPEPHSLLERQFLEDSEGPP